MLNENVSVGVLWVEAVTMVMLVVEDVDLGVAAAAVAWSHRSCHVPVRVCLHVASHHIAAHLLHSAAVVAVVHPSRKFAHTPLHLSRSDSNRHDDDGMEGEWG